ncbi:hypothetical protein HPB50_025862 [Hyalomma asiaticum]|uniref:Uncharacterized protein n=1 Tax=Hyalomma asiaticum TaxID=266040 RepID=A0ACB7TR77_HYAAI|nr:hypothetical protein HPB50_025862 [Hyalomma asiaticum]
MSHMDLRMMYRMLHQLSASQLLSLNDANQTWLPRLRDSVPVRLADQVRSAVDWHCGLSEDERLKNVAWLFAWLGSRSPRYFPWVLYRRNGPQSASGDLTLHERFMSYIDFPGCSLAHSTITTPTALFTCVIITCYQSQAPNRHRIVCLSVWPGQPLLGVSTLGKDMTAAISDALGGVLNGNPQEQQCELIQHFSNPCEIAHVTTDDGYIIELDHVPRGLSDAAVTARNGNGDRYPVLFIPAVGGASDIYFLNFPSQSPGFLYSDAGFDVWSMNTRETIRYASHTSLSTDDAEYWKFSFDEIGRYDIPACVDHVLNATGAPKLTIVAMSQGVAETLVFLSTKPEYNDKVDLVVAYGPVANVSRMGPPLSLLLPLVPALKLLDPFARGHLETNEEFSDVLTIACKILNWNTCTVGAVLLRVASAKQVNSTRGPVLLGHYPVAFGIQDFYHYHQMYKAKNFIMYDHGTDENRKRYNQEEPPAYPLERITTPVALFSSEGDTTADPRDVEYLAARLGDSLLLHNVVPEKTFQHCDFAVGIKANDFLHNVAMDLVKRQVQ